MNVIAFPPDARRPLIVPAVPAPLRICESSVVCHDLIKSAATKTSMPVPRSIAWRDRSCWPAIVRTFTVSNVSSTSVSDTASFCVTCTAVELPVVMREIFSVMPDGGSVILFVAKSANGRPARASGAARSIRYWGMTKPSNCAVPTSRRSISSSRIWRARRSCAVKSDLNCAL